MILSTEKDDRILVVKGSSFQVQMHNDIYMSYFVNQMIPNHFETIRDEN